MCSVFPPEMVPTKTQHYGSKPKEKKEKKNKKKQKKKDTDCQNYIIMKDRQTQQIFLCLEQRNAKPLPALHFKFTQELLIHGVLTSKAEQWAVRNAS